LALGEFLRGRGELREGWRRVVRSRWVDCSVCYVYIV
jgi:hypothetical protein